MNREDDVPDALYTATFTFAKRAFDDAFHALDSTIARIARSIPGYIGEEAWENAATGLISNVYYWDSLEALRTLIDHPAHQEAKRRQARWLNGYHVVIARVVRTDGDGGIPHPLGARQVPRR
ncbi:antibiotic biosynthesis monooxygenase family protein [Pseudorhodoferax sp.]|uniref:antibiotic biosynthesis monooxygenase family protein n=1 Tax=Pseudorhodoferax sp. TaxID=1993553 RepID=UPI0039E6230E